MVLCETWVDGKGWERIKEKMPRSYVWEVQRAGRKSRKGRAIGGMIVGVRAGIKMEREKTKKDKEGIASIKVKLGKEWWRVVGVYINKDMDRKLEDLKEWVEEIERGVRVLIGGDFNARTGKEGGFVEEGEEEMGEGERRSKDGKVNGEGKKLCRFLGERGWAIFNGGIRGDEEGEWTYTGGRGESVIDYVLGDRRTRERVERVVVEEKVDSDHQPVTAWVEGWEEDMDKGKGERSGSGRGDWSEEGRKKFRELMGDRQARGGRVEEEWQRLKGRIREVLREVNGRGKKSGGRGWWDEECKEGKKRVGNMLRKWRREGGEGDSYREEKQRYKKLCERKKKREVEKWEEEVKEVRTEGQVWKVVNRERKKRRRVNEGISMQEWDGYFKELLGGVNGRVVMGTRRRERREEEEEIRREEVWEVVKKLRERKALGSDGIPNEVWKFGREVVKEWLWEVCNRVWKGEGWPEDWREGIIVPIGKKGEGERVGDYRGVTLAQTAYKVYAAVLAERLRKEVEEKGLLPPSQTGFRRGVGTTDNIYVLNHLINRQVNGKKGKMVVMFVDLKAAFDSVDRRILVEAMRKRGVREGLVERCKELLGETICRVRVGEEMGERFWTGRGVRQGCPLSPILFTLLLADIDDELKKGGWGGIKLGGRKIYTLAYADDIAMLAENEEDMKGMIGKLEGYLDRKGLILNSEKTKIMRCRKGGGRWKKVSWRWKGRIIEEVRKFCYLGYVVKFNGRQDEHVKERTRRGAALLGQVWGIGKRRFGGDWGRRIWLFDKLIWTVISYGVEIWGWRERGEIERLQERYLRWVLGVERCIPGYMIREELQREKLRGRAVMRAWGYEKKLEEGKGGELARECWEEVKRRAKRGVSRGGWEEERKEAAESRGWKIEEVEELREDGMWRGEDVLEREKRMQREERWKEIGEAKFNKWYGMIKGEGIPEYLKKTGEKIGGRKWLDTGWEVV
ncbi:uncharacterized protein LOC143907534 [Temnothorax americanus]|uniref:uncharacterized protein LOC143907534 n=1 Tax=Temnothorax americanus TaxID=1964332 RepID=UPI00406761F0